MSFRERPASHRNSSSPHCRPNASALSKAKRILSWCDLKEPRLSLSPLAKTPPIALHFFMLKYIHLLK